mgnify:CR=1 FL=1
MESIQQYIKEQKTLLEQTLREMALIKAPTGHEKKRAEYCVEWLQAQGIEEVLSDECTNVIVPWNIQSGKNNCMFGRNRIDDKGKKGEVVLSGNWR